MNTKSNTQKIVYIAGTFDTKYKELMYMQSCLTKFEVPICTIDLSTSQSMSSEADVKPQDVASYHPQGADAVFTKDRGTSVSAMSFAFKKYVQSNTNIGGLLSAGGSGGTALVTPAMQALPIGVPKLMVSTVASGDTRPYVGPSDICMMYSVTDVQGLNNISKMVLANAANAMGGMAQNFQEVTTTKGAIGLTMFGVTTPCVQAVTADLESVYDCLVFHATGTGGQSMEKLVDSHLLAGVIDVSTTEVADELMGGVFSAGPERFDAIARNKVPYIGCCGALDMVNFGAVDTVPEHYSDRKLYEHNANVTLMRTNAKENVAMGKFIARKLNKMKGAVNFFISEGGVSMLDAPDSPFWDPAANKALFDTIEENFKPTAHKKLIRSPLHINDPEFAKLLVKAFNKLME